MKQMRDLLKLLLCGLSATVASADVVSEGPASTGGVRYSYLVRPSEAPAADAVRPSDRPASEAIRPSEHQAREALHPGETSVREIYNPIHYGAVVPSGSSIVREGPSSQGSVSQAGSSRPMTFTPVPTVATTQGELSASYHGSAPSGTSEWSASWYRQRVVSKMIFEGWDCGNLKYVEVGDETFRICKGTWVKRLLWGGQTSYVGIYPPVGATVDTLPGEYIKVRVGETTYLVVNVTFYQRATEMGQDVFEVVRPPLGAVLPSVPRFALELESGHRQFDDVFFRPKGGEFVVVAPPS